MWESSRGGSSWSSSPIVVVVCKQMTSEPHALQYKHGPCVARSQLTSHMMDGTSRSPDPDLDGSFPGINTLSISTRHIGSSYFSFFRLCKRVSNARWQVWNCHPRVCLKLPVPSLSLISSIKAPTDINGRL